MAREMKTTFICNYIIYQQKVILQQNNGRKQKWYIHDIVNTFRVHKYQCH